jgi:hypothetical protein
MPSIKRREHTGSYEAVRPRQLYHLDFFHLYVHKQKQVLLLIEDDFSRFIAGWTLVETENAEAVIEALNASVQRELVRKIEFVDLADARRQIAQWVRYYNFERTHHALGGILVPADRFFGCVEEMMARLHTGQGGSPLDLFATTARTLELFKIISRGGTPEIYLMGQKIFG